MKTVMLSVAFAAMTSAVPASAAVLVTTSSSLTTGIPVGDTIIATFENGDNGNVMCAPGACDIRSGSEANVAAAPNDTTYLNVLGGYSASFDLGGAFQNVSLDVGTLDDYNSFTLSLLGGGSETFTGSQLASALGSTSRITFSSDFGITGLTLASSVNSLEADNISVNSAVPEPATWALMLMGFGGMGVAMRRGRGDRLISQMA